MNVMGAFIGVDRFKVHGVAQYVILFRNAVAAVNIAGDPGDLQRLAAIVALHHGNCFRHEGAAVQQSAQLQRALNAERNIGLHIGELFLHQLRAGDGLVEDHPIHGVVP